MISVFFCATKFQLEYVKEIVLHKALDLGFVFYCHERMLRLYFIRDSIILGRNVSVSLRKIFNVEQLMIKVLSKHCSIGVKIYSPHWYNFYNQMLIHVARSKCEEVRLGLFYEGVAAIYDAKNSPGIKERILRKLKGIVVGLNTSNNGKIFEIYPDVEDFISPFPALVHHFRGSEKICVPLRSRSSAYTPRNITLVLGTCFPESLHTEKLLNEALLKLAGRGDVLYKKHPAQKIEFYTCKEFNVLNDGASAEDVVFKVKPNVIVSYVSSTSLNVFYDLNGKVKFRCLCSSSTDLNLVGKFEALGIEIVIF